MRFPILEYKGKVSKSREIGAGGELPSELLRDRVPTNSLPAPTSALSAGDVAVDP